MPGIEPLQIQYSHDAIEDLKDRLHRPRWPEKESVDDWSQGTPLPYLKELVDYWANRYDFAAAQARLNSVPHYRTTIDGLGIHFIHVQSPREDATPLLLTHGWPGSVVEFLDVIHGLTQPADSSPAFHVVIPSLPGFGWSDKPTSPGWTVPRIARAWNELMQRLGYERYGAQGGDWGSQVTTSLGQQFPERVIGVHVNLAFVDYDKMPKDDLTPGEAKALERLNDFYTWGNGYASIQSTRPQTIGYSLVDSPVGLCSWIAEKFHFWTDPESALSKDKMLDNVSLHWFTASGASSARLYWESWRTTDLSEVSVPSGVSIFPFETSIPSKRWVKTRYTDLRWFNETTHGGHFAAFEQPAIFVDEVRSFFRALQTGSAR